ncbi:probable Gim complex component GIM3 [Cephalotrichum gorgonifer]|uniref:Prefoldin subunit 4 n=1 Tax=Cephalotrichum gorgonifer TaxID=2041049 RepID=A0AAE8MZA3_9PEZI|nr:probable Gim complex component GIM3 [Cephalotrichum gorgonifer]
MSAIMQRRMLSKDEEAAGEEVEVRREDQDRINKFSRLSSREQVLEDDLKAKAKEKEELDDLSTELELADEDETVPYKIGDAFFHVKLEQAQEMLEDATSRIDDDVAKVEDELSSIRDEMRQLKVELYARFGKSINLEK